jgi:hypothetical protein
MLCSLSVLYEKEFDVMKIGKTKRTDRWYLSVHHEIQSTAKALPKSDGSPPRL